MTRMKNICSTPRNLEGDGYRVSTLTLPRTAVSTLLELAGPQWGTIFCNFERVKRHIISGIGFHPSSNYP